MTSPDHVFVDALGVCVHLELTGLTPAESDHIRALWAHCACAHAGETSVVIRAALDSNVLVLLDTADFDMVLGSFPELCERLSSLITRTAVAERATSLLMLHAGGVADPQTGRAAVMVGPSGMGKTTATRILGREYVYVSDETIGFDAHLRIEPYLKPLALKDDLPASLGWKTQAAPESLGLRMTDAAAFDLGPLLFLDRIPTSADGERAQGAQIVPIPADEAIHRLVEQVSYLASRETPIRRLRHLIEVAGGAYRVRYSEATSIAPVLAELFPGLRPVRYDRVLSRAVVSDEVSVGGRTHLFQDGRLIVLNEIATLIWRLSEFPTPLTLIEEAVWRAFGHPIGEGDVDELVTELTAAGLLIESSSEMELIR